MFDEIEIDSSDRELLYEIADWVYVYGSKDDLILHEHARRITYSLAQKEQSLQKRYVAYLRRAFPAFCSANPAKKIVAEELRRKLSDIINE